jgi:hypothetical protein
LLSSDVGFGMVHTQIIFLDNLYILELVLLDSFYREKVRSSPNL